MSIESFIKEKKSRSNLESLLKCKKAKVAEEDVTIYIGLKRLCEETRTLRTAWGKRLPLVVQKSATYALILQKGVANWTAFDRHFNMDDDFVLVNEDGSSAQFMQGGGGGLNWKSTRENWKEF